MSSIPNSAIPHARPAEPEAQPADDPTLFGNLLRLAAAPALITLGLSVLTLSHLAKRLGGRRQSAILPQSATNPPISA
jgi:hypothetical protein